MVKKKETFVKFFVLQAYLGIYFLLSATPAFVVFLAYNYNDSISTGAYLIDITGDPPQSLINFGRPPHVIYEVLLVPLKYLFP